MKTKIITDKGEMVITFYEEDAPLTVKNFKKLIKEEFYKDLIFHRVIPDFVIQGGCPDGTGSGSVGYSIPCELEGNNQYHDKGVLSMAHAGKDTGSSQFFLCYNRHHTQHLDKHHTCFGKIIEGEEVINKIKQGDKFSITTQ